MVSTWIEASARGRHGGPVRAGMWSAVVVGTHPVEAEQEVRVEVSADDEPIGLLPAFWLENKGVNSYWHAPIPPQAVGSRLRYRAVARKDDTEKAVSPFQEVVVRPNVPERSEGAGVALSAPEALVGNRTMTARVDGRGSTYDVYFPTVGLHSDVRPAEGDQPQSRSHFRAIVGGLAAGRRLDWFAERPSWEVFQRYQGATNLLLTELKWRHGPIRVLATDFVAMGPDLPKTAGGTESPGQYLKRFRIINGSPEPRRALFGVYVHAEVNGGIGEPGLTWQDQDRCLLATNRGHGHANRKLARDATVEFAVALDGRGDDFCEPTGPNEAMILRWVELPANGFINVDLLISGAFTGWRGDSGTFEHWLRPALAWFRGADLDKVEQSTAAAWDNYVEPLPTLHFPRPEYGVALRRSALAAALHADAKWGAIASGFDRGLNAYCWPRDAAWAGGALDRLGHPEIGRSVLEWLGRVRTFSRPFSYWFQKYTIDGWPEWETPAVDQSAILPWVVERHYRRTGDRDFLAACWPMVEQAAAVCMGGSGHPGLRLVEELDLISSAGIWDNRYGAYLYGNTCAVAGLRAACRLGELLGRTEHNSRWTDAAERIWARGILGEGSADGGLIDAESGRFLEARHLATLRGVWTDKPELRIDRATSLDITMLAPAVPFGLLPASDPRMRQTAEAILRYNQVAGDPDGLTRWSFDPTRPGSRVAPGESHRNDLSSHATLWMARYLVALGRETGDAAHWTRAVALLDNILGRLGPLGLSLRPNGRHGEDPGQRPNVAPGVWGLHAGLVEAVLDLAGLDYDAPARRIILEPALPPAWASIGISQPLACGSVEYRLERTAGGTRYKLTLTADLRESVSLDVAITCPGLAQVRDWTATSEFPKPGLNAQTGRVSWITELGAGRSELDWSWSGS